MNEASEEQNENLPSVDNSTADDFILNDMKSIESTGSQKPVDSIDDEYTPEIKLKITKREDLPEMGKLRNFNGKYKKKKNRLTDKVFHEKFGLASPIHAERLKAQERINEIYDLRKQGWTVAQIAFKFDVNTSVITKALKHQLRKVSKYVREDMESMRQLQLDRLDFMLRSLWPMMESGHTASIERGLQVMERQSKLLGLDAPEKKEISITVEMSDEELIRAALQAGIEVPKEIDLTRGTVVDAEYSVKEPESIENGKEKEQKETEA